MKRRTSKTTPAFALRMHETVLIPAHDLNPSAYNPNKMTPAKFTALKQSVTEDGYVEPIVVQKKGLNIIGGHHRYKVLKEIAVEHSIPVPPIPCIVVDIDDVAARKLNIKLNHVKGDPDARLLGELLVDLYPSVKPTEDEFNLLGLASDDGAKYMRLIEPDMFPTPPKAQPESFGRSVTISLEFDSVEVRDQVKEILAERVGVQKRKSGDIVAELLNPKKQKRARAA